VVKGRGRETIEEIDDNSTYSNDEVNEEEDKSVTTTLTLTNRHQERMTIAEKREDGTFERDIANTHAEVERRRKELNSHAQQGAECPPNNTTPAGNIQTAFRGRDAGLAVPLGMLNAESIMKREKHVTGRMIQFVKSELFRRIKFVDSAKMFQKAFVKVVQFEWEPPNNHVLFQFMYESSLNKTLDTKRSS
jgi:hypothetical protein